MELTSPSVTHNAPFNCWAFADGYEYQRRDAAQRVRRGAPSSAAEGAAESART
jgi:hypothetical protein